MTDPAPALVCGFWDDATELGGVAWALDGASGGLLARDGGASPATAKLVEAANSVTMRLDADGNEGCDVELAPHASEPRLEGAGGEPPAEGPTAAICGATVRMNKAGEALECFGHLTRWGASPLAGLASIRHLAIPAPQGALLVVTGGGAEAEGHGDEDVRAWLIDAEGRVSPFAEALLSTQYDDAGHQTRAGLELWPSDPDAPPIRAAGTSLGPVAEGEGISAVLLRSSMEGAPSVGSYLIWRS